jgi:hypothetical protein
MYECTELGEIETSVMISNLHAARTSIAEAMSIRFKEMDEEIKALQRENRQLRGQLRDVIQDPVFGP